MATNYTLQKSSWFTFCYINLTLINTMFKKIDLCSLCDITRLTEDRNAKWGMCELWHSEGAGKLRHRGDALQSHAEKCKLKHPESRCSVWGCRGWQFSLPGPAVHFKKTRHSLISLFIHLIIVNCLFCTEHCPKHLFERNNSWELSQFCW